MCARSRAVARLRLRWQGVVMRPVVIRRTQGGGSLTPGRQETIRYHHELYGSVAPSDSWLLKPSPFVVHSLDALAGTAPVVVYDLGCGVGRHAIPLARAVPAGSRVVGVDLLPIAIDGLLANARDAGVDDRIESVVADLESVDLPPRSADLIVGCSALEHVSSLQALEALIERCQRATKIGGLNCLILTADRVEIDQLGRVRPALVEFALTGSELDELLGRRYTSSWEWLETSNQMLVMGETRARESYDLQMRSTRLLARRVR